MLLERFKVVQIIELVSTLNILFFSAMNIQHSVRELADGQDLTIRRP